MLLITHSILVSGRTVAQRRVGDVATGAGEWRKVEPRGRGSVEVEGQGVRRGTAQEVLGGDRGEEHTLRAG